MAKVNEIVEIILNRTSFDILYPWNYENISIPEKDRWW